MRKWLIGTLLTLFLLFLAGIYFFVPQNVRISRVVTSNNNQAGVFRFLSDQHNWQNWWPGIKEDSILKFDGHTFQLNSLQFNALRITIKKNRQTDTSVLHLMPTGLDSVKLVWDAVLNTGHNPFLKIGRYQNARKLARNIDSLLAALKNYSSIIKNIYGTDITRAKISTEYMIAIKKTFDRRPTDADIYDYMGQIRNYLTKVHATEEDYPIFNITAIDSSHFQLVVGVPITEPVPDSGIFLLKKLLKNGNILTGEVTGGQNTVDAAMRQFELFVDDHHAQVIALPYQSFITDRSKIADTSKWVTRIRFPIL